jgi:hypothetical protein
MEPLGAKPKWRRRQCSREKDKEGFHFDLSGEGVRWARAQSKSFQYSSADPFFGLQLEGLTVSLCLVTKLPSKRQQ